MQRLLSVSHRILITNRQNDYDHYDYGSIERIQVIVHRDHQKKKKKKGGGEWGNGAKGFFLEGEKSKHNCRADQSNVRGCLLPGSGSPAPCRPAPTASCPRALCPPPEQERHVFRPGGGVGTHKARLFL